MRYCLSYFLDNNIYIYIITPFNVLWVRDRSFVILWNSLLIFSMPSVFGMMQDWIYKRNMLLNLSGSVLVNFCCDLIMLVTSLNWTWNLDGMKWFSLSVKWIGVERECINYYLEEIWQVNCGICWKLFCCGMVLKFEVCNKKKL